MCPQVASCFASASADSSNSSSLTWLTSSTGPCLARRRLTLTQLQQRAQKLVSSKAAGIDAPALTDDPPPGKGPGQQPPSSPPGGGGQPSQFKILYNKLLRRLSSLQLAIAELAIIAALSAVGTVVDQGAPLEAYQAAYPDDGRLLSWQAILTLGWDHVYTTPYFLGLMALLAASLLACTSTRQWPAVKVARRWRFLRTQAIDGMEGAEVLPQARLRDLAAQLVRKRYEVFFKDGQLYAFKGLAGKLGPIGVHASMVLVMVGIAVGGLGGFRGDIFLDEGSRSLVASYLEPNSPIAPLPAGARNVLQVNDFRITYRPDGSVEQFFSDLSVLDLSDGAEITRKTISVNDPLRFGGLTLYQTDWGMSALDVQVPVRLSPQQLEALGVPPEVALGNANGGELPTLRLPMAEIQSRLGVNGKTWATFLPLEPPREDGTTPKGLTLLAQDFQSVVVYDSAGKFVGVRRPGSGKSIEVEGIDIVVQDILGASGMQVKADPGIPLVYAGFGGLMLTTVVSYLSHSQVWAAQEGEDVHVAGKSNRDKLLFDNELSEVLDAVPEA